MSFAPSEALKPGVNYTARLDKGAESDSGRAVLADYQNTFTVRTPRVAYLAPSDSAPQNIWIADPSNPSSAQQVTFSQPGVFDFGVSPDGTQIAFAERNNELGTADIKLLNLTTGAIQPLTNCPDSDCTTPVWRPDGQMIAYQRIDFNSGMNIGTSPTRIWLIDLTATPPTTRPLFSDTQILSYEPEWSADGSKITVYDNADQGILVYDFTSDTTMLVSTAAGMAGTISPDGKRLVYPKLTVSAQQGAMTSLQIADLTTGQTSDLTPPSAQVQDEQVAWSPDGKTLAVVRSVTGEGPAGVTYQIYFLNADDGTARPISDNSHYVNGFFSWDPTGQQLALQRFPGFGAAGQINTDDRPSVWTYDLETNTFTEVAKNSFFPRWVP
jgi:Tol biopolymer transport system component